MDLTSSPTIHVSYVLRGQEYEEEIPRRPLTTSSERRLHVNELEFML